MARSVNIDFYRVEMPPGISRRFEHLVEDVANIPFNDPSRAREVKGVHVRLQEIQIHAQLIQLDMVRIDMDDLPALVKFSGETEELDIEDDQGLGSNTACLYHMPSHVLLVQHGRGGPTAGMVAQYFFEVLGLGDQTPKLHPLIKPGGWEEVASFGAFRGLEFTVAGIGHLNVRSAIKDGSALAFIELFKRFGSKTATVSLGLSHDRKGSLTNVVEMAKELFGLKTDHAVDVEKIEVTGKNDDGERRVIDLLRYKLKESITIEEAESRRVPYDARARALMTAWNMHSKEARLIAAMEDPKDIQ